MSADRPGAGGSSGIGGDGAVGALAGNKGVPVGSGAGVGEVGMLVGASVVVQLAIARASKRQQALQQCWRLKPRRWGRSIKISHQNISIKAAHGPVNPFCQQTVHCLDYSLDGLGDDGGFILGESADHVSDMFPL